MTDVDLKMFGLQNNNKNINLNRTRRIKKKCRLISMCIYHPTVEREYFEIFPSMEKGASITTKNLYKYVYRNCVVNQFNWIIW